MLDLNQARLRFECTRCGRCCVGSPGEHVFLSLEEGEALRVHLGLDHQDFETGYLAGLDDDGDLVLNNRPDGACIFLDEHGQCGVYAVRPLQCRSYPFWPEILRSRRRWEAERRRCEGIDRGAEVPLAQIQAALRAHRLRWQRGEGSS